MLNVLRNLLDDQAREIKRLARRVTQINALEPEAQKLTDAELKGKTGEFKQRLAQGATLEDLLPEAFAVVREVSRRVLGLRPFDVQLMGGMVLHEGKIAEMKTGEGKTLVATLPAYLNALEGKGVHIVTVNDYLARRDSEWMGKIYRFLGLKVGLIIPGLDFRQRQVSYAADITYGTNNEFGFDYLRDNMALYPSQVVQRELHYAIVDEVDSILIDEARTPLIISGQAEKPTQIYYQVAKVVSRLQPEEDYTVDEKAHVVVLTEKGLARVEKMLSIDNLYAEKNIELSHLVNQALRARVFMKRDRDYVVKDGQVIIVDEFTGRLMFGRRYSEGLHQAIEAKEGVKIERESQTLATITFQNYFRMYRKLAGMTGTAATEEEEFRKIYGLDVVVIPTNAPMIRRDLPDVVYRTEEGKFRAVVEEIKTRHQKGQPVLVGTISIEKSERLAAMLKKEGVSHQVLNAKYHEQEARIVAQAGQPGMVTIATNMAGRGTDIILGGNPEYLAKEEMLSRGSPRELVEEASSYGPVTSTEVAAAREEYQRLYQEFKQKTDVAHGQVVACGGLYVLGTERHESRRIDNQLRGRSGRQGDPGLSRFYISLEDELVRIFGGDALGNLMDRFGMDDSTPIDHPLVSRAIETAQKRVEARNFDLRKHLLEYDDVTNQQREVIYRQRRAVLTDQNLKPIVTDMIQEVVSRTVNAYAVESNYPEAWDLPSFLKYIDQVFLPGHKLTPEDFKGKTKEEVKTLLTEKALAFYETREREFGEETMRELERAVMLRVIDSKWMDHLDALDQLRQGIGLRAYGQRDPLIEYKFESYQMFEEMIAAIEEDVVHHLFQVRVASTQREPTIRVRQVRENQGKNASIPQKPQVKEQKIGRNVPCPCGSGKKYKYCCGKTA